MRVLASDQLINLIIRHRDAQAVHLLLGEAVVNKRIEYTLAFALKHLRRHALAGLLLERLHLAVDGAVVLLDTYCVAVDGSHISAATHPNVIQATRVLQNPANPERDDENPQHNSGILPELIHHTHYLNLLPLLRQQRDENGDRSEERRVGTEQRPH